MRLVTTIAKHHVPWLTLYDASHPTPQTVPVQHIPKRRGIRSAERSMPPIMPRSTSQPPIQAAEHPLDLRRAPARQQALPAFREAAMPSLEQLQNPFQQARGNTLLPGSSTPILDNKHLRLMSVVSVQDVIHQVECVITGMAPSSGTIGTPQQLLARGMTPRAINQMNKAYPCK